MRLNLPRCGSTILIIALATGCAGAPPAVSPASSPQLEEAAVTQQVVESPRPVPEADARPSPPADAAAAPKIDLPETQPPPPMPPAPIVSEAPSIPEEPDPPAAPEAESVPVAAEMPACEPAAPEPEEKSAQELLDAALELCETSSEFWDKGELDKTLDALDQAYALILKVDPGTDPELLQQRDDLRITISRRIVECYSSRYTATGGNHKAIPLVMNRHVEQAVKRLTGRDKEFFLAAYRRSGRYRPAILEALREAGMPEELSWLPLIESGFKVRALSRARALGMWQFIASTGYKFGLKRGPWVDERMDPEKSTAAAIAYLQELHHIFGDWTTVLAAYNCGETGVLRRIRTQKIDYLDDFWDLYEKLPRETASYVPKFLAVLHIIHDPQAYGITLPEVDAPVDSEEVTVSRPVALQAVADRLDLPLASLKDLNPALRHDATPDRPYGVRVPLGKGEALRAELDNLPLYTPPVPPYVVHRVRQGETLSGIADRYHSSVRGIMALNGLKKSGYLRVGWRLKVPTRGGQVATAPRRYSEAPGEDVKYSVRRGDSLWEIARRFDTTVDAIRSLNGFQGNLLQVGQVLTIRSDTPGQVASNTGRYQVVPGDYPALIARRHNMSLADFLAMNNLTPRSTIFPGQILLVAE